MGAADSKIIKFKIKSKSKNKTKTVHHPPCVKQLLDVEIEILLKNTHFSRNEIEEHYKKFMVSFGSYLN